MSSTEKDEQKVARFLVPAQFAHLSGREWWVYLHLHRGASRRDLARRARCKLADLSDPLQRLVAEGLVHTGIQTADEADVPYYRTVELSPEVKTAVTALAAESDFSRAAGPPPAETYRARQYVADARGPGVPEELAHLSGREWWVYLELDEPTPVEVLAERARCQSSELWRPLMNLSAEGLIHTPVGRRGINNPRLYQRTVEPPPDLRQAASVLASSAGFSLAPTSPTPAAPLGSVRAILVGFGALLLAFTIFGGYLIYHSRTVAEETRQAAVLEQEQAAEAAAAEAAAFEARRIERERAAASPGKADDDAVEPSAPSRRSPPLTEDVLTPGDYRLALDLTWNGMSLADQLDLCGFYLADPRGIVREFENMTDEAYPVGLVDDFFDDKCRG